MLAAALVKAAGLPAQLALVWPARLVTPAIVMVHEAVAVGHRHPLKATGIVRRALRHRRAARAASPEGDGRRGRGQRKALGGTQ